MKISHLLATERPTFSFEFFPPKNPKASEQLFETFRTLMPLSPSFVSVTYGAGGTTRRLTHDLVVRLQRETNLNVVSHLTCVETTRDELRAILDRYVESGIENIMALRGDPPGTAQHFTPTPHGFANAGELVAFLRKHYPHLCIGVAGYVEGHSETPNRLKEIDFLKAKVDAGADYICTQLFFDNRDFYDFCERCELDGITIPIIAGILPLTTKKSMLRLADLALGMRYPAPLLRALSRTNDDEGFSSVGIHWATEQVRDLLDHQVRGIHFYTFNKSQPTLRIHEALGVRSSRQLAE